MSTESPVAGTYAHLALCESFLPAPIARWVLDESRTTDNGEHTRARLVTREDLTPELEEELLTDHGPGPRIAWLRGPGFRPERAIAMLTDPDVHVRRALAGCPGLPQGAYAQLATDDAVLFTRLAANLDVAMETLGRALLRLSAEDLPGLRTLLTTSLPACGVLAGLEPLHPVIAERLLVELGPVDAAEFVVPLRGITCGQRDTLITALLGNDLGAATEQWARLAALVSHPASTAAQLEAAGAALANARTLQQLELASAQTPSVADPLVEAVVAGNRDAIAKQLSPPKYGPVLLLRTVAAAPAEELAGLVGQLRTHGLEAARILLLRADLPLEAARLAEAMITAETVDRIVEERMAQGTGILEVDVRFALLAGGPALYQLLQTRGEAPVPLALTHLAELRRQPTARWRSRNEGEVLCVLAEAGHVRDLPGVYLPSLTELCPDETLGAVTDALGDDTAAYEVLRVVAEGFEGSLGELLEVARRLAADDVHAVA